VSTIVSAQIERRQKWTGFARIRSVDGETVSNPDDLKWRMEGTLRRGALSACPQVAASRFGRGTRRLLRFGRTMSERLEVREGAKNDELGRRVGIIDEIGTAVNRRLAP
jgi:protein involved in temperature-dependent protein secretion